MTQALPTVVRAAIRVLRTYIRSPRRRVKRDSLTLDYTSTRQASTGRKPRGRPPERQVDSTATQDFAQLLAAWNAGEPGSDERLFACIYGELRKLADYHLRREATGHTLQATALAHEAYLKLAAQPRLSGTDRAHFCAIASRTMRQILVDYARRRHSAKRGGGYANSPLDSLVLAVSDSVDLVELDIALEKLARLDLREASVVELRFFAGLTVPEIARALGISIATVERDWTAARAWLRHELAGTDRALD